MIGIKRPLLCISSASSLLINVCHACTDNGTISLLLFSITHQGRSLWCVVHILIYWHGDSLLVSMISTICDLNQSARFEIIQTLLSLFTGNLCLDQDYFDSPTTVTRWYPPTLEQNRYNNWSQIAFEAEDFQAGTKVSIASLSKASWKSVTVSSGRPIPQGVFEFVHTSHCARAIFGYGVELAKPIKICGALP